eukprot:1231616-Pyramimonas_sp.AAC.1
MCSQAKGALVCGPSRVTCPWKVARKRALRNVVFRVSGLRGPPRKVAIPLCRKPPFFCVRPPGGPTREDGPAMAMLAGGT